MTQWCNPFKTLWLGPQIPSAGSCHRLPLRSDSPAALKSEPPSSTDYRFGNTSAARRDMLTCLSSALKSQPAGLFTDMFICRRRSRRWSGGSHGGFELFLSQEVGSLCGNTDRSGSRGPHVSDARDLVKKTNDPQKRR